MADLSEDPMLENSNSIFDSLTIRKSSHIPEVVLTPPSLRTRSLTNTHDSDSDDDDDENAEKQEKSKKTSQVYPAKNTRRTRSTGKLNAHADDEREETSPQKTTPKKRTPKRKALSPIKNIMANILQSDVEEDDKKMDSDSELEDNYDSPEEALPPLPVMATRKRRAASLPGRVQPKRKTQKSTPARSKPVVKKTDIKEPDDANLPTDSPVNGRKFFKHKSPASASKAIGGIIVRKGFNLHFVRGLLNKDFGQSPNMKKGPSKLRSPPSSSKKRRTRRSSSSKKSANTSWESVPEPLPLLPGFEDCTDAASVDHSQQESGDTSQQSSTKDSNSQHAPVCTQSTSSLPSTLFMSTDEEEAEETPSSPLPRQPPSPVEEEEEEEEENGKFYSIFSRRRSSRRQAATYGR
jgi:hypothetical protein